MMSFFPKLFHKLAATSFRILQLTKRISCVRVDTQTKFACIFSEFQAKSLYCCLLNTWKRGNQAKKVLIQYNSLLHIHFIILSYFCDV